MNLTGLVKAGRLYAGGKLRTPGAVVLAYHDIQPPGNIHTGYIVTPELLRSQLSLGAQWGLTYVTLADLTDRLLRGENIDNLAAVVFDDALVGVHHHAAEVLTDLNVPGTLLPLCQDLGAQPRWWPDAARTMTLGEIGELIALGWTLASHSQTHPSLTGLPRKVLCEEIMGSKAYLEDVAGSAVTIFAYPFGHHDEQVREVCAEAGYAAGYTFLNGRVIDALDRFRLPRLTMTMKSSGYRWAYHLSRSADSWPDHQMSEFLSDLAK